MKKAGQWKRWLCCILAALILGTIVPVNGAGEAIGCIEAEAAAKPRLNKTSLTLKAGKTYTLKLKNAKKVTWKSENKKIAKIGSKGKVTAVKAGTVRVYAVYKNKKYYCTVTVKKETQKVTDAEKQKTVAGREELAREAAAEIIKAEGMAALSDVAKVKAVHDYLILNAEYDQENLEKDTLPEESFEAYGIIVKKTGVCDGYAKAFKIFMELLGIPCERTVGYAGSVAHAWNIVTLDGERYHIDTTWDDPVPDKKGYVQYDYFLLNDAEMKKDHIWSPLTQACNGTKYRTYPYEEMGIKADTLEQAQAIIKSQYEAGTPEKFEIQILAKNILSEKELLSYLGEIWEKEGARGYSYYAPVKIGEYYFYHYFAGTEA